MRNYADLRPPAHKLALFIRASLVDDGKGGPWLWVSRSIDRLAAVHHIALATGMIQDQTRMVMLSGPEVLEFAEIHNWRDLLDPTAHELRALGVQAMTRNDVTTWAHDYPTWVQDQTTEDRQEEQRRRLLRAQERARVVRTRLVEQWLTGR